MLPESSTLDHSLAVEVKDCFGRIKDARYITNTAGVQVEFVPNRMYLYLLNRGVIKSDTYKIPFLLGMRHKEK